MQKKIFDRDALNRALIRISHEILERNRGSRNLAIVGLQTRGVFLAQRIAKKIKEFENTDIPVGIIDVTLYRDDVTIGLASHKIKKTEISFPLERQNLILVDDVFFTGRSIRAAIDGLIDFGRPRNIQLAVLIDRGHRELPIRPDYVGKDVTTARDEIVRVKLSEEDGEDVVFVEKNNTDS